MRIERMAPRLIATPAIASMATMPAAQQSKDTIFFMFLNLFPSLYIHNNLLDTLVYQLYPFYSNSTVYFLREFLIKSVRSFL